MRNVKPMLGTLIIIALAAGSLLNGCADSANKDEASTVGSSQLTSLQVREELPAAKSTEMIAVIQKRLDEQRAEDNLPSIEIVDAWIMRRLDSADKGYLIGKGNDSTGKCNLLGLPITFDGFGKADMSYSVSMAETEHKCTGNPCTSCDFTRDANNQITGCSCSACVGCNPQEGMHCDHTIISS